MDSCCCALPGNFRVGISRKDQDLEGISCNIKTSCQTGKPVIRFETQPGQQMQVDFTTIRRNNTTLKAFVATLGYSRATFVKFYDHERTDAWIDGLENAFQFFAGVPQEILFDNAKTIMIERDAYQEGQQNGIPNCSTAPRNTAFVLAYVSPTVHRPKVKLNALMDTSNQALLCH